MDYIYTGISQALDFLISFNPETYAAIKASLLASAASVLASIFIGTPLGFLLGYYNFKGKNILLLLVNTLLCFPTVVIGLLIYILLAKQGPLGNLDLLFSLTGIAIGQFFLGLPIVIALVASTIREQNQNLSYTLRTLGANSRQVLFSSVWESRYNLILAYIMAYSRIITEVGISMLVGGNIKWHTRTITTAITLETGKGQFANAIALGMVLLLIAFSVNLLIHGLKMKTGVEERK